MFCLGLILEDADDVEYSVSAKGSSRSGRKPLHSNSTEPVSAPRIASSTRNLVASSWNVSDQVCPFKSNTASIVAPVVVEALLLFFGQ